jgi:signal peptidase
MTLVGVDGVSMTPTMRNGDLAIVEKKSSYHVGDVVAYRIPAGETGAGAKIIHRIVGGNGKTGFVTRGDHNSYTDYYWHPRTKDVLGKVWFHVPVVAGLLGKLHQPGVLAAVVALVTFGVIAWPSKRPTEA